MSHLHPLRINSSVQQQKQKQKKEKFQKAKTPMDTEPIWRFAHLT